MFREQLLRCRVTGANPNEEEHAESTALDF